MSDLILVNSKFTASTFANTFKRLDARGIQPAVLYPAVNVDQFDEPKCFKYVTSFALDLQYCSDHPVLSCFSPFFVIRLNFLSINRFERKKNIELAISSFAMLRTFEHNDGLQDHNMAQVSLTIAGKKLLLSAKALSQTI